MISGIYLEMKHGTKIFLHLVLSPLTSIALLVVPSIFFMSLKISLIIKIILVTITFYKYSQGDKLMCYKSNEG